MGERSLAHWQQAFGRDDPQTMALAVEVASVWRRLGQWREAMDLNLDTLGRLRAVAGAGDRVYLLCAKSRGIDLALLGDYGAALGHDLELLPSFERAFGRGHLETLQLRNEIAISLRCLGRYQEALEYDQQTCADREGSLGPEDTRTLTSRFAIARDLRLLGRSAQAHELLAGVDLTLARKPFASRQFQLLVEADLAVSLRRCGRYPEALARAEEAFRQYEVAFGSRHRETLRAGINLVSDLRIAGRLPDAESLGQRLAAEWTATAGADHPNTLAARSALASVLRAQGNPLAALRTDEHVAVKLTGLFGETHPSTLAVLTNAASDLALMGQARGARQAGERSLRLHARTLGSEHPRTIATAANLSLDRHADGDTAGPASCGPARCGRPTGPRTGPPRHRADRPVLAHDAGHRADDGLAGHPGRAAAGRRHRARWSALACRAAARAAGSTGSASSPATWPTSCSTNSCPEGVSPAQPRSSDRASATFSLLRTSSACAFRWLRRSGPGFPSARTRPRRRRRNFPAERGTRPRVVPPRRVTQVVLAALDKAAMSSTAASKR